MTAELDPPVTGTAAFIMVAIPGIASSEMALHAAGPALVDVLTMFVQLHVYARGHDRRGMPAAACPQLGADAAAPQRCRQPGLGRADKPAREALRAADAAVILWRDDKTR